eukprot:3622221-Prymnesium_polylepis.1
MIISGARASLLCVRGAHTARHITHGRKILGTGRTSTSTCERWLTLNMPSGRVHLCVYVGARFGTFFSCPPGIALSSGADCSAPGRDFSQGPLGLTLRHIHTRYSCSTLLGVGPPTRAV